MIGYPTANLCLHEPYIKQMRKKTSYNPLCSCLCLQDSHI